MSQTAKTFNVPVSLVTLTDVSRLIRELDVLDSDLRAQEIRHEQQEPIMISDMLRDAAKANGLDLTNPKDRDRLMTAFRYLKAKSPVIHITFAERPKPDVLQPIIAWIRAELHPATLLRVGLQPGIVAGCIVRTPNHVYDMSIRHVLQDKKPLLLKRLRAK